MLDPRAVQHLCLVPRAQLQHRACFWWGAQRVLHPMSSPGGSQSCWRISPSPRLNSVVLVVSAHALEQHLGFLCVEIAAPSPTAMWDFLVGFKHPLSPKGEDL